MYTQACMHTYTVVEDKNFNASAIALSIFGHLDEKALKMRQQLKATQELRTLHSQMSKAVSHLCADFNCDNVKETNDEIIAC